jgi:uncharacterized protein
VRTPDQPWQYGTPCWAELITPDPGAAVGFYETVFDWEREPGVGPEAGPEPASDGVFHGEDGVRAGIGPIPAGLEIPAVWVVHFIVEDVDATVSAVEQHGGTVLHPVRERSGFGRGALVADPTGAVFGVVHLVAEPIVPAVRNEPGALITVDLRTNDAPRAREFYAGVFDFRYEAAAAIPGYTSVRAPGSTDAIGGIGELDPEEDLGEPSHWLVYLALDTDTDSAVLKAQWSGGQVLLGPYDVGGSRNAMLADPQGARFAMMGDHANPQFG